MSATVAAARPTRLHRRSVATTVIGNFVEYFDGLAYGLFAALFADEFFPSSNPVTSLLGAFAVFAVGYLFRPLGGILLGRLADRRGRKPALMVSIAMMASGSTLIGISPTYDQIGLLAPVILLIARAAQGLSAGGEWPAAITYLMEMAPTNRRCFYGALFSVSASCGAFVAALMGGGLTWLLGRQDMAAWGWRIPFLFGGLLGLVLLLARRRLTETPVFQRDVRSRASRGSLRKVLTVHSRQVLLVALFISGLSAVTATWTAVVPSVGQRLAAPGQMFWVVVLVTGVMALLLAPLGLLADKVGAARFLATLSIGFAFVGPYAYLGMTGSFGNLVFAYGSGIVFVSCVTATMPSVLAAIYPPDIRALGIGLPVGVVTAVVGGVTPWLATYLRARDADGWFVGTVVAVVLVAWLAATLANRRFAANPVALAPTGTTETGAAEIAAGTGDTTGAGEDVSTRAA